MINAIVTLVSLTLMIIVGGWILEKKLDSILENQKTILEKLNRLENLTDPSFTFEKTAQPYKKLYNII